MWDDRCIQSCTSLLYVANCILNLLSCCRSEILRHYLLDFLSKVCVVELIVVFPEVLSKVSNPLYMLGCPGRSYPARYTAILATSRDCSHITWSRNPASVSLLATLSHRTWVAGDFSSSQLSQKRSKLSDCTFWKFFYKRKFFFLTHLLHAKPTLNSSRRLYKKRWCDLMRTWSFSLSLKSNLDCTFWNLSYRRRNFFLTRSVYAKSTLNSDRKLYKKRWCDQMRTWFSSHWNLIHCLAFTDCCREERRTLIDFHRLLPRRALCWDDSYSISRATRNWTNLFLASDFVRSSTIIWSMNT